MTRPFKVRSKEAGVTLVEMLVVLSLFAIVAGATLLSLPTTVGKTGSDLNALSFVSTLDRAVDLVLVTGEGFGLLFDDEALSFAQQSETGEWVPHSDPQLAQVKLFPETVRSLDQAGPTTVFPVSARLVPEAGASMVAIFGTGTTATRVVFDGVRARLVLDAES